MDSNTDHLASLSRFRYNPLSMGGTYIKPRVQSHDMVVDNKTLRSGRIIWGSEPGRLQVYRPGDALERPKTARSHGQAQPPELGKFDRTLRGRAVSQVNRISSSAGKKHPHNVLSIAKRKSVNRQAREGVRNSNTLGPEHLATIVEFTPGLLPVPPKQPRCLSPVVRFG